MNLEKKMEAILIKRKELNLNDDYEIQKSWDEIIEILSENEENSISYLENCNKEDLYWISEVFEDLAESLQSKELINCLRKLDEKYPDLEMTNDIDIAESYIE
ncbi:hypothetical protein ACVB9H_02060 [Bacillus subtilis]|uniref:hypothetical protein n=1 Tax=Bacillus TaxID=1386 RepID=UPI000DEFD866|nr:MULTISPECIES: hypothetical protein [Bacillus]MBW4824413.1 hypothetical protein [Bacillaceae bacterium]AXF32533.1 hypothetical protein DS740_06660 [Bacillus sp. DM2]MCP8625494.1 hypothetical protein [Bacillus subtilis]MEC1265326.1 hypothetical protein [Bacillus subtilis]QAS11545.1 hypothetical protein EQI27_06655 [Bacillus subtilis]